MRASGLYYLPPPGWALLIQASGPAATTLPGSRLIGGGSRVSQAVTRSPTLLL